MKRLSILKQAVEVSKILEKRNDTCNKGFFIGNGNHERIMEALKKRGWLDFEKRGGGAGNSYKVTKTKLRDIEIYRTPVVFQKNRYDWVVNRYTNGAYQRLLITSNKGISFGDEPCEGGIILGKILL